MKDFRLLTPLSMNCSEYRNALSKRAEAAEAEVKRLTKLLKDKGLCAVCGNRLRFVSYSLTSGVVYGVCDECMKLAHNKQPLLTIAKEGDE